MRKEKSERDLEEEEEEKGTENETTDIYDDKQLEEMLENDEITEAEYSFMLGREKIRKKKKLGLERKEHEDTKSVELAQNEYEYD
jgi:hypothetical protein